MQSGEQGGKRFKDVENPRISRQRYLSFPRHVCQYKTSIPYALFHTTKDSLYWSLMPWHLESVAEAFKKEFISDEQKKPRQKISDRTAHIGVDLLHLSQLFPCAEMEAYESCPETFQLLKSNLSRLGQCGRKWTLYNTCGASRPPDQKTDLVYLDPNWGGRDYKDKKKVQLVLGHECVSKIITQWLLLQHLHPNQQHQEQQHPQQQQEQDQQQKDNLCVCLKAPVNWPVDDLFPKSQKEITYNTHLILNGRNVSYVLYFFYKARNHS